MSDFEITPASDTEIHAISAMCGACAGIAASGFLPSDNSQKDESLLISLIARIESEHKRADAAEQDAARYRWLAAHCRSTREHWGGRWSIIVDGPAPKTGNSEDDFDDAIDAAMKAKESR